MVVILNEKDIHSSIDEKILNNASMILQKIQTNEYKVIKNTLNKITPNNKIIDNSMLYTYLQSI